MQTEIKKTCLPSDKVKKTLLIFFLLTVFGLSASIFAEENSLGAENIFLDSDQDGLSDTEEISYGTDSENRDTDGDGYSDGAEIKSGYDPLKPAPGDKIVESDSQEYASKIDLDNNLSSETNLTEELSIKIASMVSDGETGPEEITVNDIDSIIDESISKEITFDELPEIDTSEIIIKNQDYPDLSEERKTQKLKEDEEDYASTVLYIMSNNLPHNISSEQEITSFLNEVSQKATNLISSQEEIEYFNDLAEKGEIIVKQMKEVEVPENMVDTHIEALQIAKSAISLKDKVKIDMNDPIASLLSLSYAENVFVMVSDFLEKMKNEMDDSQNNIEDYIFENTTTVEKELEVDIEKSLAE